MKTVKEFLQEHWDQKSPLLLGYSGGPDSKALLYALIEADVGPYLHLAHVDHGWRPSSAQEAEKLRGESKELNIPFHCLKIEKKIVQNAEDAARKERLVFFQSLCQKIPFQALILAHQADELVETTLKRVFEGAHLTKLGGMEKVSFFEQMVIWRPLLQISKKEIFTFLSEKGLSFIEDSTNKDPKYLRARMREEMIPFLHRSFGKNIIKNLQCLSERSIELNMYLDQKTAHCPWKEADFGAAIYLNNLERIEKRHLLQRFGAKYKLSLRREVIESLVDWVADPQKMRKIRVQFRWIVVMRGWIILFSQKTGLIPLDQIRNLIKSF